MEGSEAGERDWGNSHGELVVGACGWVPADSAETWQLP